MEIGEAPSSFKTAQARRSLTDVSELSTAFVFDNTEQGYYFWHEKYTSRKLSPWARLILCVWIIEAEGLKVPSLARPEWINETLLGKAAAGSSHALFNLMPWRETEQGIEFWGMVYDSFKNNKEHSVGMLILSLWEILMTGDTE